MAAVDWPTNVKGQTITDVQVQPFSGQTQLPGGATATANEIVLVLGNGHTIKICGIKLSTGAPRTVARDVYQQASTDTDIQT